MIDQPVLMALHYFEHGANGADGTVYCKKCGRDKRDTIHEPEYMDMPCNPMCFTTRNGKEYHHITCDKFDPDTDNHTEPESETIAEEASRIVYGDREKAYDDPNINFEKLAHIWTGLALRKLRPGVTFTPNDVALFLIGLKMSRESFMPNRENRVDGVGYWLCLDRIVIAQERCAAEDLAMMDEYDAAE